MNNANRRVFLTQAAALSCGALWRDSAMAKVLALSGATSPSATDLSGKSLLAKMKWLNEPRSASTPSSGVESKLATLIGRTR